MRICFMNAYRNITLKALKGCIHDLQQKTPDEKKPESKNKEAKKPQKAM